MTETNKFDIIQMIKEQHQELKRHAAFIRDEKLEPLQKKQHLLRFVELLLVHSEAEEQTLYDWMQGIESERLSTQEAYVEHGILQALIDRLEAMDFKEEWNYQIEAVGKV